LLGDTNINTENVKKLAGAAEQAWDAILKKDLNLFSAAFLDSFNAQTTLFPSMMNPEIEKVIESYKPEVLAWKLAGAGGRRLPHPGFGKTGERSHEHQNTQERFGNIREENKGDDEKWRNKKIGSCFS
jgi:hypothetical protein